MAIKLLASLESLVNSNKNLLIANKTVIGDLILDASHIEDIVYKSNLTNHYVEDGSLVSDHILLQPVSFSLHGSITDDIMDIVGYAGVLFNLPKVNINNISNKSPKQMAAYQLLTSLVNSKSLVTVVAYLDTFTDMAIENLVFSNDANTGNRLFFKIELKKANFATVETVNVGTLTGNGVNSGKNLQDMVSKKTNLGIQQTQVPQPKEVVSADSTFSVWTGLNKKFFPSLGR
jgi:hypothetical protein